jgi:hypothetical protein
MLDRFGPGVQKLNQSERLGADQMYKCILQAAHVVFHTSL